MVNYTPISWSRDIYPNDYKYLTFLVKVFRHEFRKNWFRRISTSLIESEEIMNAVIWNNLSKLKKIDLWYLKTKASVWILRSYLDNEMNNEIQPVYNYFMDYFFTNTDKWFEVLHKIWWEIIWEDDPILDAILIYIMYIVLNKISLKNTFEIYINTVWVEKERNKYREELQNFYEDKKHMLSENSLENLKIDPILLLLSKNEDEQILAKETPKITKFLKKDSKLHYKKFIEYLELLKIPFIENNTLVSKYDFDTNSVWEFIRKDTQERIAYWTRHNVLSTKLWAQKEVPAVWFYAKSHVLISMLKDKNIKIRNKDSIDLFFVQLWDEAKKIVLKLSLKAREEWINTVVSLWTPSIKEQMLKASRSWAKFVIIVWVMEARSWIFQVRDNVLWTQEEIEKDKLIEYIIEKIWIKSLDFYCPAKDLMNDWCK